MKYTRENIVIGTIIKISSKFTITRIKDNKIFFNQEREGWDIDQVLKEVNNKIWEVIYIPIDYEIY